MARATSLSFSPDDSATFALACWDGKVALFVPTTASEATASPPDASLPETPKNTIRESGGGGGNDVDSRRTWKQVWREAAAATPGKIGGGNWGGNLEDQDGAFLCWCKGSPGSDASAADLAVSAYRVTTGDCLSRRCEENRVASSGGETSPTPITTTGELPRRKSSQAAFPPAMATGPGFELFAERGLGERVGGAVSGSRPAGLTPEPTAERYLIHGMATGPSFVALYDSDFCLHVVSLAAILSAGHVLVPPPPPTPRPIEAVEVLSTAEDTVKTSRGAAGAGASTSLLTTKVTLVSNDHGLIAAGVRQHRGPEGEGADDILPSEDGLELSITWRNAISRVETPDDGKCIGREAGEDRRLSFLPGELEKDDRGGGGDGGNGGVFGADVRWGRFALFTRYTVLVYTRPDEGEAAGKAQRAKGGNSPAVTPLGGWRAYAEHPVVHGVLLGGEKVPRLGSGRLVLRWILVFAVSFGTAVVLVCYRSHGFRVQGPPNPVTRRDWRARPQTP